MLSLVENLPGARIRIFSGLKPGAVKEALLLAARGDEDNIQLEDAGNEGIGTVIAASDAAPLVAVDHLGCSRPS